MKKPIVPNINDKNNGHLNLLNITLNRILRVSFGLVIGLVGCTGLGDTASSI